ncbi:hypothetical protein L2E82_50715 [Cichorium intybus]|nr:hypothetical protein L2E82_50715 [Cichorium intybus]
MPYLNFSTDNLLSNLVSNVLSRRNDQIQVSSVNLGWVSHESVKTILDYAYSHNVKQVTWELDESDYPLQISTQDCPSLEKVDLCIFNPLSRDVHEIVCLLQQIHGVKFLTLNMEILELISSSMGVISHQPFAFADFKILKFSTVQPIRVYLEVRAQEKVTRSTEIKNNQLDIFSSAIFADFSSEEIRVLRDILLAQKPVAVLEVGPEQCKTLEQRKIERLLMRKL